jgi:hypothetical protein
LKPAPPGNRGTQVPDLLVEYLDGVRTRHPDSTLDGQQRASAVRAGELLRHLTLLTTTSTSGSGPLSV